MNITIKDVPEHLHAHLKEAADRDGRSINKQIIYTLERAILSRKVDRTETIEKIRSLREQIADEVDVSDMEQIINQDRP